MRKTLLLLILFTRQSLAENKVLAYAPTVVELTGELDLQTFPGPPNFESIKNGDDVERHFYLKLDKPFDVSPTKATEGVENAEDEKNIGIVQLAISEEDDKLWNKFRKAGRGALVRIKGTLFHRFTGHHHSRVLLAVTEINLLKH
jgi:hypothetical protein